MPIIHVELFEGRTLEAKRAYVKAVTDCTVEILKCKPETVTVVFSEMKTENYAHAGQLKIDADEGKAKV